MKIFQTHIAPASASRRSFSIHVIYNPSSAKKANPPIPASNSYVTIDDLADFKSSLQLYPMLRTKSLRKFYSKRV